MEYSKYLFDVDVSKLADRSNREQLLLRDVNNKKTRYSQIVVMMLDDTVRCVLRADYDESFGEYYYVATYRGKNILVKENDIDVRRGLDAFYIEFVKAFKYGRYDGGRADDPQR